MESSAPLFSYAVIADTHLNQGEDDCNSPFEVNRLANARLRYIVDDLNQRDISHVIHLGDIVHPVPSMGDLYADSAARFHEQTAKLQHPIFIIPGNHDVGDKPIDWGPAGTVRQSFLDAWQQYFGAHYFKHRHQGVVFVGINAQVLGSGLPLEQEQNTWLHETLQAHKSERIHLFTHYPPFLFDTDEEEHYDNLNEAARGDLLSLIDEYAVEALFAGHVHHFWYNRYRQCDCYLLPSTCFTRQDYSEMFRIGPAQEHGRNDADKLGYLLVHVFEDHQQIEMVRSYGNDAAVSSADKTGSGRISAAPVNAKTNRFPAMGFDLRSDWCEKLQIPPSGGLDEFNRKWVRNDYGLLALWEMGIKHLRVPAADLLDLERAQRLRDLAHLGFRFTLYSFSHPSEQLLKAVENDTQLFDNWELGFQFDQLKTFDFTCFDRCKHQGVKIFASPLRSKDEIVSSGKKYYHVINHGFMLSDDYFDSSDSMFRQLESRSQFDGIVLRCSLNDPINEMFALEAEINLRSSLKTIMHLRMTADNPAEAQVDEGRYCSRIAEAMFTRWADGGGPIFCDSFV
nr:metallophosphoesterase [Granulosicoccus sp.]